MLAAIFARLKGDLTVLPAARANLLLRRPLLADGETLISRRRARALHLAPPGGARALPGRRAARLRPRRAHGAVPRAGAAHRRDRARAGGQGLRLRRRARASAPTTTRCATSRCRPWAIRPWCASRSWTTTRRRAYAAWDRGTSVAETLMVLQTPALHADLERHVLVVSSTPRARCRTARRRSRWARCRGRPGGPGPPGARCRRRAAPRPGGPPASRPAPRPLRSGPAWS